MKSLEFAVFKMAREQAKQKVYMPPELKAVEDRINAQDAKEIFNTEMARKLLRERRRKR
jgi:hypothetical protein